MSVEAMFNTYKQYALIQKYTRLREDLAIDVCLMLDMEEKIKHITAPQISYSTYFQIVLKLGDDSSPTDTTIKERKHATS